MFDPEWVLVIYAVDIGIGILLVVGLNRYVDLERWLGLDIYSCVEPEPQSPVRPSRSDSIENPVVCPGCGAVSERDYSYCWACVSQLPHSRFTMLR